MQWCIRSKQLFDKVFPVLVVVQRQIPWFFLTLQKTAGSPQLQFLDKASSFVVQKPIPMDSLMVLWRWWLGLCFGVDMVPT